MPQVPLVDFKSSTSKTSTIIINDKYYCNLISFKSYPKIIINKKKKLYRQYPQGLCLKRNINIQDNETPKDTVSRINEFSLKIHKRY